MTPTADEREELVRLREELAQTRTRERAARKIIAGTHKQGVKHTNCRKEFCPICVGGLFVCVDCGAAEVETEERICSTLSPASADAGWPEALRRFLDLFNVDGEALIVPEGFDANEFTNAWDEASRSLSAFPAPAPAADAVDIDALATRLHGELVRRSTHTPSRSVVKHAIIAAGLAAPVSAPDAVVERLKPFLVHGTDGARVEMALAENGDYVRHRDYVAALRPSPSPQEAGTQEDQTEKPRKDVAEKLQHVSGAAEQRVAAPSPDAGWRADQIEHMVRRFLTWKLPDNFNPDGGISFKREFNENTSFPRKAEPVGTNLFDYEQAKAMVRHMLEGLPASPAHDAVVEAGE